MVRRRGTGVGTSEEVKGWGGGELSRIADTFGYVDITIGKCIKVLLQYRIINGNGAGGLVRARSRKQIEAPRGGGWCGASRAAGRRTDGRVDNRMDSCRGGSASASSTDPPSRTEP